MTGPARACILLVSSNWGEAGSAYPLDSAPAGWKSRARRGMSRRRRRPPPTRAGTRLIVTLALL